MEFEWDDDKNKSNIEKHGLSFEIAPLVFGGFYLSKSDDRKNYGEPRRCAMGTLGPEGRVVIVAYTVRQDKMRVISMRKANNREQKIFYEIIAKNERAV
jgi:uncharacterized DUF497 family protein